MDRKTRKIMTMNHVLPCNDIDGIYLPKKRDRCGMLQYIKCLKKEKWVLEEYLKDNEEDALKLVYQEGLLTTGETNLANKKDQIKNRMETWEDKALHGQYITKK
uniref:Uncharacterized protein n=1 Tax=Micrurus spixii TaxID=129469 RepID=A0A2D4LY01_9SAUR